MNIQSPLHVETMVCSDTGAVLRRGVRPFTISCRGQSVCVDLPGYYPEGASQGVMVGDDMAPSDAALRDLL